MESLNVHARVWVYLNVLYTQAYVHVCAYVCVGGTPQKQGTCF